MNPCSARTGLVLTALALPLGARQAPRWSEGFEGAVLRQANALVVHDSGSGPELVVSGIAPVTQAGRSLAFDGASWRRLQDEIAFADAVSVDFGTGPEMLATTGSSGIHRFAGGTWSLTFTVFHPPVFPFTGNAGTTGPIVAWDDGSGPAVYVGGRFLVTGSTGHVLRHDGSSWTALGGGLDESVSALAVHDDGGGPGLYAAGNFQNAGGAPAPRIARWRNGAWSAVPGLDATSSIAALASHDDGGGTRLYAGGVLSIGGATTHLAAWDGSAWTAIGAPQPLTGLHVHDDGGGPALFAAGRVGLSTGWLGRWRGGSWTELPIGSAGVGIDMASHEGRLWIAGTFAWVGPGGVANVRAWDGAQFLDAWRGLGLDEEPFTARVLDYGAGPRLVAGGWFRRAGTTGASRIAAYDGTSWASLGSGLSSIVRSLATYDDGTGTKLYAGGAFDAPASRIARFDGANWTNVGGGITGSFGGSTTVNALEVFDDGTGPALYAGGAFGTAGGVAVSNVARWNGTGWSALGAGFGTPGFSSGEVLKFAVYDEGAGPRLFAIGRMTSSGATPLPGVARWNGSAWEPVGTGLPSGTWYTAIVHDDGSGPALYVGGTGVRRWNGTAWTAVNTGITGPVFAFAVHDDGSGPRLHAGTGNSASAPARPGLHVWDGATWTALPGAPGGRINERVIALASFDAPSGEPAALYAFGSFQGDETISTFVAKWSRATEDVLVCVGDGSGAACPCGNASPAGLGAGCLHAFGQGGVLRTSGVADVLGDTLVLSGSAMPGASTALYFQGSNAAGLGTGVAFGDGLRCATGLVLRLAAVANVGGASVVPQPAAPTPISVAGAIPPSGGTRIYQAWYRNSASFCTPAAFNLTNGVRITWRP